MYFADAIQYAAEQLVVARSSRERQGLTRSGERLLTISEIDVNKRDSGERSRLLVRRFSGLPKESRSLKMADGLQHRCTRAEPFGLRRQRNAARSRDACLVAVRFWADYGKHDFVPACWSTRLGCCNTETVLA